MKIAITSIGNSAVSTLDPRFGRCSYFAFYDTETCVLDFVPNPNKDANEGAGPASAQFVATRGVTKVVSGEFGGKVKTVFDTLGIAMEPTENVNQTVASIIAEIDASRK